MPAELSILVYGAPAAMGALVFLKILAHRLEAIDIALRAAREAVESRLATDEPESR